MDALLRRLRHRIRRIVSIRLTARLTRVLEDGELPEELLRTALHDLRDGARTGEAGLLRTLARLVEREVRRRPSSAPGERRGSRRTLRVESSQDQGPLQREDLERVLDARVAGLAREDQREVLLLRDYCGASWELVRERLGLLSVEAAQELYRRAHGCLARGLRSRPGSAGPEDHDPSRGR